MKLGKVFTLLLLFTILLLSAIPQTINYQGKLANSMGVGLNDTIDITFRLYTSESGGEQIWEENHSDVPISKGLFSVDVGSIQPFGDDVDFSSQYYLEVMVGSEVLSPREKLSSTPYAIRSEHTSNAIQSIHTDELHTPRTGRMLFRTGPGASLSDLGDSIIIRIDGDCGSEIDDFSVEVSQSTLSIYRGESITNDITILSIFGDTPPTVSLSMINLPTGVTATFSPDDCTPTCPSVLTISSTEDTPPGTYTLTIVASDGSITRTARITLIVNIPFDYTLIVDPESSTIDQGSATSTVVTANLLTGFPEEVSFSVSGLPSGCLATFSPTSCILSCSATMTVNTSVTTPPGNYTCQITAMTTSGVVRTTSFDLNVEPFRYNLSINPTSGDIKTTEGEITSTISTSLVSPITQNVTFSTSSLPTGLNANFNPSNHNPSNTSQLTFSSSGVTPGIYPIDIIGNAEGGTERTETFSLTVCDLPGQITDLTASPGPDEVTLNWSEPIDGNCSIGWYMIYSGTVSGGLTLLDSVSSSNTDFTTAISSGTTYYFQVSAVNLEGEGPLSNEVEVLINQEAFAYTGGQQTWTVPSGVNSLTLEVWGAQGSAGNSSGGLGGYAKGILAVTPGEQLYIYIGGQSGWNGGGSGYGSGGGGTDIRVGGTALADRVIVAGGGGGGGQLGSGTGGASYSGTGGNSGMGGGGGSKNGSNYGSGGGGGGGAIDGNDGSNGQQGGSYSVGIGGAGNNNGGRYGTGGGGYHGSGDNGTNGTLGTGGSGGSGRGSCAGRGGGGGGGYYGGGGAGGGGGHTSCAGASGGGGGGGSNYIGGVTSGTTQNGVRSGDGQVKIWY